MCRSWCWVPWASVCDLWRSICVLYVCVCVCVERPIQRVPFLVLRWREWGSELKRVVVGAVCGVNEHGS